MYVLSSVSKKTKLLARAGNAIGQSPQLGLPIVLKACVDLSTTPIPKADEAAKGDPVNVGVDKGVRRGAFVESG